MSLSDLLIKGKKRAIDKELDSLFSSTKPVLEPRKKRKVQEPALEPARTETPLDKSLEAPSKSGSEENTDSEEAKPTASATKGNSDGSDSDEDDALPVHESLLPKRLREKRDRTNSSRKYVPEEETSEQRDARTIFVGNLPIELAQQRSLMKQLTRHIVHHVPNAKIESTRLRSVAFQLPTSKLPDDQPPRPEPRPHDLARASSWRASNPSEDTDVDKDDKKTYLTPAQKKKIAFINRSIHSSASSVHAYIVFAYPIPAQDQAPRAKNVPPPRETLDPFEAARLAVGNCDGSEFMGRMLRVDLVGNKNQDAKKGADPTGDPKLSVFVGNLDFESKDEDVRAFFEGVLKAELGEPEQEVEEGDDEGDREGKLDGGKKNWVRRVRIVRDKETQLGKGFGYVQFANRRCVDEVLAMDESKLKFAKRKLRVQRCKTLPSSYGSNKTAAKALPSTSSTTTFASKPTPISMPMPKGDPSLGASLAHLSKDERKAAKSSNVDRVARRLAKKKARNALGNVDSGFKRKEKGSDILGVGRKRDGGVVKKPTHKSKGRVRSEKSEARRNMKK